jgi:uncharacterized protein (DUF1015 family)
MMRIHAFQGITYQRSEGDPPAERGRLAAPPYDQIDDRRAEAFHGEDRHHFTWLSKPVRGESEDVYQEAARVHDAWLESGEIRRDERPALYPYEIVLPDGSTRLGITALVGLERPDSGLIRPHEETLAKPLADRLALLRAMEVDLEPVLLLSEDGGELDALIRHDVEGAEPFVSHTDEYGNRHDLYRVTAPERILRYRTLLGEAPAAIADGHHRYKVALRHAEDRGLLDRASRDTPPPAAAAKLAVITSLDSPALDIQPIHRVFPVDHGVDAARQRALSREPVEVAGGAALAAAVAAADDPSSPAIGVQRPGETPEIWRLDPEGPGTDGLAPGARQLAVSLLHSTLYPAMGLAPEAATDGTTSYRSDPEVLWNAVASGEMAVGIYLPPMAPQQFAAAIAEGDMLPPKSTRFLPKVVSGLVWAGHDAALV